MHAGQLDLMRPLAITTGRGILVVEVALDPRHRHPGQQVLVRARVHAQVHPGQRAVPAQRAALAGQAAVLAAAPQGHRRCPGRLVGVGAQRQHEVAAGQHLLEAATALAHRLAVGAQRRRPAVLTAEAEAGGLRASPRGLLNPPGNGPDGAVGHRTGHLRQEDFVEGGEHRLGDGDIKGARDARGRGGAVGGRVGQGRLAFLGRGAGQDTATRVEGQPGHLAQVRAVRSGQGVGVIGGMASRLREGHGGDGRVRGEVQAVRRGQKPRRVVPDVNKNLARDRDAGGVGDRIVRSNRQAGDAPPQGSGLTFHSSESGTAADRTRVFGSKDTPFRELPPTPFHVRE